MANITAPVNRQIFCKVCTCDSAHPTSVVPPGYYMAALLGALREVVHKRKDTESNDVLGSSS